MVAMVENQGAYCQVCKERKRKIEVALWYSSISWRHSEASTYGKMGTIICTFSTVPAHKPKLEGGRNDELDPWYPHPVHLEDWESKTQNPHKKVRNFSNLMIGTYLKWIGGCTPLLDSFGVVRSSCFYGICGSWRARTSESIISWEKQKEEESVSIPLCGVHWYNRYKTHDDL